MDVIWVKIAAATTSLTVNTAGFVASLFTARLAAGLALLGNYVIDRLRQDR